MQVEDQPKFSASANRCSVTGIGRDFNPFVDPYLAEPHKKPGLAQASMNA
jgi:hypothetical protein